MALHTNKAVEIQKQKRQKISRKSQAAVDSGDIQAVIDSLPPKMIRFCEEYLVDMVGTKAAIRAGYAPANANRIAYQMLENPAVRIAIDALRAERSKGSVDVTKDYVLQGIKRAIRQAEESGNANATLRGYELLAKHLGMFIERQEISGPDGEAIKLEQKTRENVRDFTSAISRLASVGSTGGTSSESDG